jgi:GT2 family glycosyltransferase
MVDHPLVSVVMPVKNEEAHIERAVRSILDQTYPRDRIEVVVVDGQSTDATREIVRRLAAEDPRVRLVENEVDGRTPVSFNRGVLAAQGELLSRLDGHAWMEADFIENGVRTLIQTGAAGVGGHATFHGEGTVGEAIALAMQSRFGSGNASFRVGGQQRETDTLMFGVYRRDLFDQVGLYDEALTRNEDDEWHHRVRAAGGRLLFTADMRFSHLARPSFRRLFSQYWQWGLWRTRTLQKHRRPFAPRQLAPPALLAGLVVAVTVDAVTRRPRMVPVALGLYGGTVMAAGTRVAARRGKAGLGPFVALAMSTMHVSYGAGCWWELLRGVTREHERQREGRQG